MTQETKDTLQIYSAGVARKLAQKTIERWNEDHPELQASLTVYGSVDLARRVLNGERCDVLIVADDMVIKSMLIPKKAKDCQVFAGNRMVVSANEGYEISSENWKEKLLAPDATFDHHDPYGDPGGYRAVMAMMLADRVEPGLSDKILNHPGHFGMDKNQKPEELPEIRYSFEYYTTAVTKGVPFAELPKVMNLSDPALAEEYAKVQFAVDDENTVAGTPICHALTIPVTAKYSDAAHEFVDLFLKNDFSAHGFLER